MRIAKLPRWPGFLAVALALLLAGCGNLAGTGNHAAICGGKAYDNVMFNSDRHNAADRATVASILGAARNGEVSEEGLARVTSLAGERDARRIVDEYGNCLGE